MIGELFVNEKDAFVTWKAFLEDGSEAKLLTPASMKEYASNNARSQAGKQVFVANPQPESRDVNLTFCFSASSKADFLSRYRAFVTEMQSGLILIRVPSLGETYKFICSGFQELSFHKRVGKLSVRFTEPNPKDRILI